MFLDQRIAMVVRACNAGLLSGRIIETMPTVVKRIAVMDDQRSDDNAALRGQSATLTLC